MHGDRITFCFDIDGTICTCANGAYRDAVPYADRIEHIHRLFESGYVIKMFTARGSTTGVQWAEFTAQQLTDWGVCYHELILGKPHADVFVDDKAIHSEKYSWAVPATSQGEPADPKAE
jgi:hypothetical protein